MVIPTPPGKGSGALCAAETVTSAPESKYDRIELSARSAIQGKAFPTPGETLPKDEERGSMK